MPNNRPSIKAMEFTLAINTYRSPDDVEMSLVDQFRVIADRIEEDEQESKKKASTRMAETTNGKLDEVINNLVALIGWAKADSEHAAENDAPGTAKDDRRRAKALKRAHRLVMVCYR